MFNTRQHDNRGARQPDHTARLTKSLGVSVWQSIDPKTGKVKMHWDVSRISGTNPSKTFKTMLVESLLEFPAFLAHVAIGFAKTEAVSPELRTELYQFAEDMESIVGRREGNGVDKHERAEDEMCVF